MLALLLIWPFLVALAISLLAMPITITLAKRYGLVDDPNTRPHPAHVQNRIVPRAGGLPIFIGLFLTIPFFIPIDKHILGIIIGAFILLVMGLLDDKLKNFSPYLRFLLQFLAAGVAVASGIGIPFISNPFGGVLHFDQIIIPFQFLGQHRIILFADLFALIWTVWIMNVVNWSKGVDGQMPGIILVTTLTIGIISTGFYLKGDPNQLTIAKLAFITAGTSLALLIFNWHPAKIFPGFSGSNILGFMVAILAIFSSAKVSTAIFVMLIPAIDSIYLILKRTLSGHSPMKGDRNHLHHKLLDLGWSHHQISLFYIISCAILGSTVVILSTVHNKILIGTVAGVIIIGTFLWLQKISSAKA